MQQKLHDHQRINSGGYIVQHNACPFRQPLQLSHRRWLQNIEDTKKYKTRQKSLPRERHGNERDQLPGNFVDNDKLWIFRSRRSGNLRCGGDTDQNYT